MLAEKHPMFGPLLKIERADYHMKQLESFLRRYVRMNAKPFKGKKGQKATEKRIVRRLGTKLPIHTPVVIGDIVHNLRVSLDHAYWVLVEANGGEFTRYVKFPFGGDKSSVKGSINGTNKNALPAQSVLDYIVNEMQPFDGGAHDLYDLHNLDIMDKHKLLLPTTRGFFY